MRTFRYDGADLVKYRKNVVLVTLEYRMSVFGCESAFTVATSNIYVTHY